METAGHRHPSLRGLPLQVWCAWPPAVPQARGISPNRPAARFPPLKPGSPTFRPGGGKCCWPASGPPAKAVRSKHLTCRRNSTRASKPEHSAPPAKLRAWKLCATTRCDGVDFRPPEPLTRTKLVRRGGSTKNKKRTVHNELDPLTSQPTQSDEEGEEVGVVSRDQSKQRGGELGGKKRFGQQTPRRWGWGIPLKKRAAARIKSFK